MNGFSSNAASVYVSPALGAMAFAGNTWQQHSDSWLQAVQGCTEALAQAPKKAHALTVFVGAGALRATVLGAECGARSLAEYQALAQQQLTRHSAQQDWMVQCALISPRLGTLAVALPSALLDALRQWAARARIKSLSVQPAFLAPLRASAARLAPRSNTAWALVLAEPGALVTVQTMNTNAALATNTALALGIQTSTDVADALPREQARARFAAGPSCTLHTWQLQTATKSAAPASRQAVTLAGLQFVPHNASHNASESAP